MILAHGAYYINLIIAENIYNNQLAAFINCFKFEVITNYTALGAGILRVQPQWESELV